MLTIRANVTGTGIELVRFLIDGEVRALDNNPPYSWDWDTRMVPNGEHKLEIQGLDLQGVVVNSTVAKVIVAN
jgi:hypothetical protein